MTTTEPYKGSHIAAVSTIAGMRAEVYREGHWITACKHTHRTVGDALDCARRIVDQIGEATR